MTFMLLFYFSMDEKHFAFDELIFSRVMSLDMFSELVLMNETVCVLCVSVITEVCVMFAL